MPAQHKVDLIREFDFKLNSKAEINLNMYAAFKIRKFFYYLEVFEASEDISSYPPFYKEYSTASVARSRLVQFQRYRSHTRGTSLYAQVLHNFFSYII